MHSRSMRLDHHAAASPAPRESRRRRSSLLIAVSLPVWPMLLYPAAAWPQTAASGSKQTAAQHPGQGHKPAAHAQKPPVVSPPPQAAKGDKSKARSGVNAHATGKNVPKAAAAAAAAGAAGAAAAVPAAGDAAKVKPPPVPADPHKGIATGLPLPRFAALRADEVNMRVGPDTRYPIQWIYKRRELPVEIVREFQVWRLVQDQDGVKGWVHQATLTGRRTFLVSGSEQTLRHRADDTSSAVALLKSGVVGRILECEAKSEWCQVQVKSYRGYLRRAGLWGLLPDEVITR